MVAAVCVDTHDNWVGISDDGHDGHGTFEESMHMVQRPSPPGTSPESHRNSTVMGHAPTKGRTIF